MRYLDPFFSSLDLTRDTSYLRWGSWRDPMPDLRLAPDQNAAIATNLSE